MSWKEKAEQLKFDEGLSWKQVAEKLFPNENPKEAAEKVRGALRQRPRYKTQKAKTQPVKTGTKSIECKADGTQVFEGIVALMEGEPITPETIMCGHNLDPAKWEVLAYKSNFWQAQQKGGGVMLLYQTKITVKPKALEKRIDFDAVDKHFKSLDRQYKPMVILPARQQGTMTAEVNIADLHFGKLCWHGDTDNNYDYKIAREIF